MGICIKSKPTAAAALLALSGLGATTLFADGRFIVQPSLRKPAPVAVQPEPVIELKTSSAAWPALAAAESLNAELLSAAPLSFESLSAPSSAYPVNSTPFGAAPAGGLELSGPQLAAPPYQANLTPAPQAVVGNSDASGPRGESQATYSHSPQFAAENSRSGLQWIARGARTQQSTEPQPSPPFQVSGPNFSAAAAAALSPRHFPTVPEERARAPVAAPFSLASTRATAPDSAQDRAAPAQDSAESSRAVLASLVSRQIISGRPAADEVGRSVHSIDNPPGWQAIGEELSQRLGRCEELINRKAYFSAREDAETAMLYLVRVLDLMSNHYYSEPAWQAASKAMSEAEDFSNAQRLTSDSDFLRRVILSHETPVLKDADANTLAPLAAAQHYRQYAEEKLVEAAQGHPWASEVLYALGRSYQAQAAASQAGLQQNLRWRAITLYRGARAIAPANATATNQLGFVLLQMDRPADAREALVASINAAPSLAAYENLVEASRRLGDANTGNWAMQQAMAAKNMISAASSVPEFVEVDPRTFAAMSPYSIGPNPQSHEASSQAYRTALSNPTNR